MATTSDRITLAEDDLQHDLRTAGIEATVCELNLAASTVVVSAHSVVDWLLAKHELGAKGLTAIQPF
jgi:hypothetical protein